MTNDLGFYDGVGEALDQTLVWGAPYFLGRLYLCGAAGLRELALGVVLGGLLYVPLCLYESRMSPQLHLLVYGFHQREFQQSIRLGGYRPMVFMQHGLEVGLWMTVATLTAYWLYRTSSGVQLRPVRGLPPVKMVWAVHVLPATAVLCRSTGALVLGAAGDDRVRDAEGKEATVADGLWIITLGERGFAGLIALGLTLLLPTARFVWLFPPRRWGEPAAAVVLMLFAIDCLMNAMVNPVYLLAVGGLAGLTSPNVPPFETQDAASLRSRQTGRAVKRPGGFARAETAPGR